MSTSQKDAPRTRFFAVLAAALVVGCGGGSTPTEPPVTPPVNPPIGASGGTVNVPASNTNAAVSLVVPPGALAANTTITVTPLANPPALPAGAALVAGTSYTFQPDGLQFQTPAALTLGFTPTALPAGAIDRLGIFRLSGGVWTAVAGTVTDRTANTVRANITGFSSYAIGVLPINVAGRLSVGSAHACAIRGAGEVVCWGSNTNGVLGDGSLVPFRSTPAPIAAGGRVFKQVSVNLAHSCALDTDGAAYCWGSNSAGELGRGSTSTTPEPTPTAVATTSRFTSIAAGFQSTCGLETTTGRVLCWGNGGLGSLQYGLTPRAVVSSEVFVSLAGGAVSYCAVNAAGTAYCWGYNAAGQVGDGTTTNRPEPVLVAGGLRFKAIASGSQNNILGHMCGITTDDVGYCWGGNVSSQLGATATDQCASSVPPGTTVSCSLQPTAITGTLRFRSLSPGTTHTCGTTLEGSAYCWGQTSTGALGNGALTTTEPAPVAVSGLTDAGLVSSGSSFSCSMSNVNLAVRCWGTANSGQLGDGTQATRSTPFTVPGLTASRVSVGQNSNICAENTTAATLRCWGAVPVFGATTTSVLTPTAPTPTGLALTNVSVGGSNTCAIEQPSGFVYCAGQATALGDGTTAARSSFGRITGSQQFVAVSAGASHVCGLDTAGVAWCWGSNTSGQLGDGTTVAKTVPVQVSTTVRFSRIEAGEGTSTCGIAIDGTGYCWGFNRFGQAGSSGGFGVIGAGGNLTTPVAITGLPALADITVANSAACAIAAGSTGQVYCWGAGIRGDGSASLATGSFTPVAVDAGVAYRAINSGSNNICGIVAAGGQVRCWGQNLFGAIGDGTFGDRLVPTPVQGLANAAAIGAGGSTNCAVLANGSVACWGNLPAPGDGSFAARTTPVTAAL